ncbi:MAG: hypothetical protein Q9161_002021 [Pseudevernia consocians]
MARGVNGIGGLNSRQVQIVSGFITALGSTSAKLANKMKSNISLVPPNTGSNVYPGLWTAIEASLGIVAASLPSLGLILHKITGHPLPITKNTNGQSQHKSARSNLLFGHADTEDLEHILETGPQRRDDAAIMNAFVGRSSTSFETRWTWTSHEMKTLGKDDDEATEAGGIAVRKDVEQRVE